MQNLLQAYTGISNEGIAHYDGLMKMIELRGGLDTLKREVANQIFRSVSQRGPTKIEKLRAEHVSSLGST